MALGPGSTELSLDSHGLEARVSRWFHGLFRAHRFSPEQVLTETPEVDPLLKPRAPMKSDNIDPALMMQFRSMGFKHAQEITAETHPEFYLGWEELCRRAGFTKPLQLIVTDNNDPNAIDASESEVVMSTGLLKMLNTRELLAVLGHELGHAKHDAKHNSRAWIEVGGALGGGMVGDRLGGMAKGQFYGPPELVPTASGGLKVNQKAPNWFVGGLLGIGQFAVMIGGALAGWMISKQFSVKPSELRADREGVMLSGDPEALISAFQKMQQLGAGQSSWKQFMRYAWSGYPTFDQRIKQVREVANQIPADRPPVYQMIELLAQAPMPPEVETAQARQQQAPVAKVRNVAETERVVYVPENSVIH